MEVKMTLEQFLRHAKRLIFIDFIVAAAGAYIGVQAFFWFATVQCGH